MMLFTYHMVLFDFIHNDVPVKTFDTVIYFSANVMLYYDLLTTWWLDDE